MIKLDFRPLEKLWSLRVKDYSSNNRSNILVLHWCLGITLVVLLQSFYPQNLRCSPPYYSGKKTNKLQNQDLDLYFTPYHYWPNTPWWWPKEYWGGCMVAESAHPAAWYFRRGCPKKSWRGLLGRRTPSSNILGSKLKSNRSCPGLRTKHQ